MEGAEKGGDMWTFWLVERNTYYSGDQHLTYLGPNGPSWLLLLKAENDKSILSGGGGGRVGRKVTPG